MNMRIPGFEPGQVASPQSFIYVNDDKDNDNDDDVWRKVENVYGLC